MMAFIHSHNTSWHGILPQAWALQRLSDSPPRLLRHGYQTFHCRQVLRRLHCLHTVSALAASTLQHILWEHKDMPHWTVQGDVFNHFFPLHLELSLWDETQPGMVWKHMTGSELRQVCRAYIFTAVECCRHEQTEVLN